MTVLINIQNIKLVNYFVIMPALVFKWMPALVFKWMPAFVFKWLLFFLCELSEKSAERSTLLAWASFLPTVLIPSTHPVFLIQLGMVVTTNFWWRCILELQAVVYLKKCTESLLTPITFSPVRGRESIIVYNEDTLTLSLTDSFIWTGSTGCTGCIDFASPKLCRIFFFLLTVPCLAGAKCASFIKTFECDDSLWCGANADLLDLLNCGCFVEVDATWMSRTAIKKKTVSWCLCCICELL